MGGRAPSLGSFFGFPFSFFFALVPAASAILGLSFALQVCGDKDADGFYRGECAGREGYIPCNMVSEVQVENNEIKMQLLKQGFLPADPPTESIGTVSS